MQNASFKRMPVLVYLVAYGFSTLVGALFLLWGWPSLIEAFQASAGILPYWLSPPALLLDLLLLLVAPALLWFGYEIGLRSAGEVAPIHAGSPHRARDWQIALPWAASTALAIYSLWRGGAFRSIGTWLSYREWVGARWQLFSALSFFEYVNIYSLLPTSAVVAALWWARRPVPRSRKALPIVVLLLVVVLIQLLVFQKKPLIAFLLFTAFSVFALAHFTPEGLWRRRFQARWLAAGGFAVYLIYSLLVALPAANASYTAAERLAAVKQKSYAETTAKVGGAADLREPDLQLVSSTMIRRFIEASLPGRWIGFWFDGQKVKTQGFSPVRLAAYILLAPFFRTPVPALLYPAVFPNHAPFYGLDLGLDILGLGRMPDDNLVVYRFLWPDLPGGSVMVPFQFALYSQVGLAGALALSLVLGVVLARLWCAVTASRLAPEFKATLAGLFLLFCVYLAIDAVRNSLLVSYGVGWAVLFVIAWALILSRTVRVVDGIDAPPAEQR